MHLRLRAVVPILLAAATTAQTEGWARFRGPNGSGVAEVANLPADLAAEGALRWRTELPPGHSSPVLTDTHVYLTAVDDEGLWTYCLERATGAVRWRQRAPRDREETLDNRNNPASPSPVVDADVVVVFFPEFGLVGYEHTGKELWRMALGPFNNVYGMGASPILVGGAVLLACDQSLGSYLLAVSKTDGSLLWRAERPEAKSGHCTPIIHQPDEGAAQLLLPGSFFLDAYDVTNGRKLWWASGLCFEMKSVPVLSDGLVFVNGFGSPMNQPGNQIEVDPFEDVLVAQDADGDERLSQEEMPETRAAAWFDFVDLDADGYLDERDWDYLTAALGSINGMLAFRVGGEGDVTEDSLVWAHRKSVPQLPSPLVYRDVLYMLHDSGGLITTFRPASGEVLERGRIEEAADAFYASPVAGDEKVYLVSLSGIVVVLPAGGSLEPLSVLELDEMVYATPALAEGALFLRSEKALYCFGAPAAPASTNGD